MKPDAFLRACPSRDVLERIAEKWASLAIVALSERPLRFNELKRRLEGVSQKMLTQTLRKLERDGLIARIVVDQRPLRVDYALRPAGRTLLPIIQNLKQWAERHFIRIEKSNASFDKLEKNRTGKP
jgi:DNA-binding HxlR family transcriptional regulator